MKEIVINDNHLTDNDMEKQIIRVKGLIINSAGKILLAHNNHTYQFPGGHVENNESKEDCIIREIREETGIELEIQESPFLCITTYDNNYFGTGNKIINTIYYYKFNTDKQPDFSKTQYDELELETDFNLFYVNLDTLEDFLKKNIKSGNIDKNIGMEMLYVMEEYNKIYGGQK